MAHWEFENLPKLPVHLNHALLFIFLVFGTLIPFSQRIGSLLSKNNENYDPENDEMNYVYFKRSADFDPLRLKKVDSWLKIQLTASIMSNF